MFCVHTRDMRKPRRYLETFILPIEVWVGVLWILSLCMTSCTVCTESWLTQR
jgi:hypothetical protein